MQKINKTGSLPQIMVDWIAKNTEANWQDFPYDEKQALREVLHAEQDGLCCYCCFPITTHHQKASIEHLADKHQNRSLQFAYQNLLLSCTATEHCNSAKKSQTIVIHPLHDDCDESIKMNSLSAKLIGKKHKTEAEQAIEILNLNHLELVHRRQNMIKMLEDYGIDIDAIQNDFELKELALDDDYIKQSPLYHELKYIINKLT